MNSLVFDSFAYPTPSSRFHVLKGLRLPLPFIKISDLTLHILSAPSMVQQLGMEIYSWEDSSYLARRSLGVSLGAWTNLDILLFSTRGPNVWMKDLTLICCDDCQMNTRRKICELLCRNEYRIQAEKISYLPVKKR